MNSYTKAIFFFFITIMCLIFSINVLGQCTNPDFDINITASQTSICAGQTITLLATGAGATGSYNWLDASDNLLFTGDTYMPTPTVSTSYKVRGFDTAGCEDSSTVFIQVLEADYQIYPTNPMICTGSSVELHVIGNASAYTWSPNTDLNTTTGAIVTATPTSNQTYTATMTFNGCTFTETVNVLIDNELGVDILADAPTFCSVGDAIQLTAFGASNYTWETHPTLTNINGATATAMPTETTTYRVTGTDNNGCMGMAEITLHPSDLQLGVNTNMTLCEGNAQIVTATVTSTHTNRFTYEWTPTTGVDNPTLANPTFSPSQTTIYTLKVTDESGCEIVRDVRIMVLRQPTLTADRTVVCNGQTATLTLQSGDVDVFGWMPNTNLVEAGSNRVVRVSPTETTTYCVTGIFGGGGCVLDRCVTIEVAEPFMVDITASAMEVCAGGTVTLSANGGNNYVWSASDGSVSAFSSTIEVSPTQNTTYEVDAFNNCFTDSENITINVRSDPAPEFSFVSSDVSLCPQHEGVGLEVMANVTDISWSPTTGLSTTTGNSVWANPSETTIYTVTATNADGCTNSVTIEVRVVGSKPSVVPDNFALHASTTLLCSLDSIRLTAPTGANSYTWLGENGIIDTVTIGNTLDVLPNADTEYTVIADYVSCQTSANVAVTVAGSRNTDLVASEIVVCPGETVQLTASGGTLYTWVPAPSLSHVDIPNPTALLDETTTYFVNIADNAGCIVLDSITIIVSEGPLVDTGESLGICLGETVMINTANVQNANSLQWTGGLGTFSDMNTLQTVYTPDASEIGEIALILEATNECGTQEDTLLLMINTTSGTIDAGETAISCDGQTVDLMASANGAGMIQWSGGNGTFSNANSAATQYLPAEIETTDVWLYVDFDNGCSTAADSVLVSIQSFEEMRVPATEITIFRGADASLQVEGGSGNYEWTPTEGLSCTNCPNPIASPSANTTYTVIDIHGCADSITIQINVEETDAILLPTAFSPNGDNHNDQLHLVSLENTFTFFELSIYNRWGTKVFQTSSLAEGWDGTYQNEPAEIGVYMYSLEYQLPEESRNRMKTGTITLLR